MIERLRSGLAGRYTIERELGRGGMAIVYIAQDVRHSRQVAIKVLRPELTAALGHERFLREITTTANLRHPQILPLFDSGETNGILFYVMPFVEGETLRSRLVREKQLPLDDALQIAREVADALAYAHSRGVVHRDIKPENILLEGGHAVVADFGIARAISAAGTEPLTQTGLAVGTPQYMSPEQLVGRSDLDGRSDLYALACVLYEMLAGEPPHAGPTAEAILARRLTEPIRPLRDVRHSVPAPVEHAIARALAKVPADRYATAMQFTEALTRPSAAVTPASRIRPRTILFAAVGVVALGFVAVRLAGRRAFTLTTTNAIPVTTDPGIEFQPALSLDGKEVAFIANGRIAVSRTVAIGGGGELHPTQTGGQFLPTWSPDGEFLRYWGCEDSTCDWKEVGRLGGPPRRLDLPFHTARMAWSRDGSQAAFVQGDSISLYTVKGRVIRLLVVHPHDNDGLHSLAWSPDGSRVAYVAGNPFWRTGMNIGQASIWIATLDGKRIQVTRQGSLNVSPQWLDARHLLFVSDRQGQREIYVVEVGSNGPRGEPQKVAGGTDAHSISVSADGSRLAFAKYDGRQQAWAYPLGGPRPVSIRAGQPITLGAQVIEGLDISRDGQWLVYDSNLGANSGGGSQIFKLRVGTSTPVLVTPDGSGPQWSPDGREISFQSGGNWVVSADGSGATRVTSPPPGKYDQVAYWSPDGLRLAFWSDRTGFPLQTWLVTRERIGGPWSEPVQLTNFGCTFSAWVPDGSGILCRSPDEKSIVLVSLSGAVRWRRDVSAAHFTGAMPVYSPDGTQLYIPNGRGIWSWPAAGGTPRLVVAYDDPSLRVLGWRGSLSVTRDRLYATVSNAESDIWVMDLKR